jgi:hypothetical protein
VVFDKFPRNNPKIKSIFDDQIATWAYELSKAFPYNFLRVWPLDNSEIAFPLNLATVLRAFGDWLAPGWLITDANQGKYQFAAPFEYDQWDTSPLWWSNVFTDRVWYLKEFDSTGRFIRDLPICNRDMAFSQKCRTTTGQPEYFYISNTEDGSFIHLLPVPDKNYLYAIEFQQTHPPFYVDTLTGDVKNKFLSYAPRVLELYSLIQVSSYFDEPKLKQGYEEDLFGAPRRGLKQAINEKTGLIGDLVNDSMKMTTQGLQTMPIYSSARDAVGRNGFPRVRRFINRWGYH